ncbi:MAG TPA: sigma-70 family RNA polymerase sigma factor [Galbitalea sp.]|jgi:RNA polymerase sigma-70 factor (ECF subfamily)
MAHPNQAAVEAFELQRPRLVAMAHRMLGSGADAEDAVQEAWIRLARQDIRTIDNLSAWLTTVVGRVCIDTLRSRKARPETPVDEQILDWAVTPDDEASPESNAVLAESVGLALLVVLDALGPDERLAFVLHDTFAVPFDQIGPIIGKSSGAAKMLASRARRKVQGAPHPTDRRQQSEVVDAFLEAARGGDFDRLLQVLDPDVTWRIHTAKGVLVRVGAEALAESARLGPRARVTARRVGVNGKPGVLAWRANGKPLALMACTVVDDRIVAVDSLTDPDRLATIDLPDRYL